MATRVLFLCHYYWPHVGGVETHVAAVAQHLPPPYQVTVVTEQDDTQWPLQEERAGVRIIRMPKIACRTMWSRWHWWLFHLNLLLAADIVHIHDVFFWLLPWRPLFFWQKWFITFHGYEGVNPPNWKQRFWHKLAACCTNGSLAIGRWHQRWYGVRSTAVSYGAVQVLPQYPAVSTTSPHAVFIGRLSADTGIMTYLEALAWLQKTVGFNLPLVVYGDGPDREKCEEYAHRHHLPVDWRGWQADAALHLGSALIVFASRYLSILEALAAGRPVIAHYNNNIKRDYLRCAPFRRWISIGHATPEIAKAIWQAQKLPAVAQQWAQQQSWSRLAHRYISLWQSTNN